MSIYTSRSTDSEESNEQNFIAVPDNDPGSSDPDDLEVVSTGTSLPLVYQKEFEYNSPYQPPSTDKHYYLENSQIESSSHPVYEGASGFYNSFQSDKNEEMAYSLGNSPNNPEPYHYEEVNHDPEPKYETKPKKKKDKSARSSKSLNSSDSTSKSKKRKSEHKESKTNSKKLKSVNNIIDNEIDTSFPSKHIPSTLSEDSSDSAGMKNYDYTPSFSVNNASFSTGNTIDSDEDKSFQSHSKSDSKAHKRKSRQNADSGLGLKKRIESSNKGNLLMQKMGYREGEGLGKNAQGRVEPVELSKQKGRRGLGLTLPGLDGEQIEWDPSLEEINEKETVEWLENNEDDSLDFDTMVDFWVNEGPRNEDISSMTEFIDEEILNSILVKKSIFDNLSEEELRRAVTRSNPFESIRKGIFLNRAALKMANMDSAFDYMFTNPKYRDGIPMVKENELLYFADVCAGPGGFSEYVFFRKKWHAKGIGFTLKGDNDFKLHNFLAGPSETFEPYYGVKNDGNIYDPDNIKSLTEFVMKVTNDKGVHFMMADGGFSVKGKENIQELLSKQLYLCQFLVALSVVREEGHFVCKLFDLFSEFSAGLIYLMYRSFHKICIFKPNTSRPANSERYIICKHKRRDSNVVRDYLFEINSRLWKLGDKSECDVTVCVPTHVIKDDIAFYEYLRDSNNRLGNRQIVSLDKIAAYYQDQNLHEPMQNELRTRCMQLWNVPTGPRKTDQTTDTEATSVIFQSILKEKFKPSVVPEILNLKGKPLSTNNVKEIFNYSILDWHCIPLGSDKLCFLLGLGRNRVYRWNNSKWEHESNIELAAGTLIYGEFIAEFRGEGSKQTRITTFHIIDGFALGYKPIAHYPYDERLGMINLYSKALQKWNNNSLCPIRVKNPTALKNIVSLFQRVGDHYLKSSSYRETCFFDEMYNFFMQIKGIVFVRTTREPWRRHKSKKHNIYYYYNSSSRESVFEQDRPDKAVASALDSLKNQVLWTFERGVGFKGEDRQENVLHKDDLLEFIENKQKEM